MPIRRKTLEEFFWARVHKTNDCWIWKGQMDGVGYGKMVLYRDAVAIGAHRASWMISSCLAIPDGMYVCHSCDNKRCVRPDHLFVGSQAENIEDARKNGRLKALGHGWRREITHCPQGHQYTKDNTYRWNTQRICRKCHAAHEAKRRQKLRRAA